MALKMSRTGVRADQVNVNGLPIASDFFNKLVNDLPTWTDLPSYVGGTEQLLPVNDDEPETSPILCDIQYPDSLRNDQYFTYRESPTTKDGLAKIRGIRGNTLVWNQLVRNGNFTSGSYWIIHYPNNGTFSVSNNEATLTLGIDPANNYDVALRTSVKVVKDHTYLIACEVNLPKATEFRVEFGGGGFGVDKLVSVTNSWVKVNYILKRTTKPTVQVMNLYPNLVRGGYVTGDSYKVRNVMYFDLTAMGYDSLTADQFQKLYSLSYYKNNTGSLLSFTGTKVKTVGFNQWDEEWEVGNIDVTTGQNTSDSSRWRSKNYISIMPNTTYYCRAVDVARFLSIRARYYDADKNYIGANNGSGGNTDTNYTFKTPQNAHYMRFSPNNSDIPKGTKICINISNSDLNGTYEPYTSNETELPISTFFPTGMKSAGSVYDELTPTRAITRIGAVDLGSLTWQKNATGQFFASYSGEQKVQTTNLKSVLPYTPSADGAYDGNIDMTITIRANAIWIRDSSYETSSAFASALSGVYLFYELATPVVEATMSFE